MAGKRRRVTGIVGGVVDCLGMREADPDDQEASDQQSEDGGDHRLGTRGLNLLDILILH
jgi:hypothetical protein